MDGYKDILNDLLKRIMTDEFLDAVHNGNRDLDVKKFNAFKTILAYLKNHFSDDEDVKIRAGLLDTIHPTSGWISISGDCIQFNDLNEISDALSAVSNIEITTDVHNNVVISMIFYSIVIIEGIE